MRAPPARRFGFWYRGWRRPLMWAVAAVLLVLCACALAVGYLFRALVGADDPDLTARDETADVFILLCCG